VTGQSIRLRPHQGAVRSAEPADADAAALRARVLIRMATDESASTHDAHCVSCQAVRLIATFDLNVLARETGDVEDTKSQASLEMIAAKPKQFEPGTRRIRSRFAAGCCECFARIAVGDSCVWSPDAVWCLECAP
jgi:hypothetical protein